jgi:hypothetical protein
MQTIESVRRDLLVLEATLLQPDVRKSARVSELLADDFVEFASSGGIFTKAQVVESLQKETPVEWEVAGFEVRILATGVAIATYLAHRKSNPPVHSLRSSVWRQTAGGWQMLFHQGTLCRSPTPARLP